MEKEVDGLMDMCVRGWINGIKDRSIDRLMGGRVGG
jgi:hypothetical protein